jgi:hypothetical protein
MVIDILALAVFTAILLVILAAAALALGEAMSNDDSKESSGGRNPHLVVRHLPSADGV